MQEPQPDPAPEEAAAWASPIPVDMDFTSSCLQPYIQAIQAFRQRRILPGGSTPKQQQQQQQRPSLHRRFFPNFLKAVRFAPDGSCLLSTSDDAVVRLFDLPHHLIYDGVPAPSGDGDDGEAAATTRVSVLTPCVLSIRSWIARLAAID